MAKDYLNDLINKVKEKKKSSVENPSFDGPKYAESAMPAVEENRAEKIESIQKELSESIRKFDSGSAKQPVVEKISEEVLQGAPLQSKIPEKSFVEKELETSEKIEIASYGNAKIYKLHGKPMLYYYVPVPRSTGTDKSIINTLKEAATRLISFTPYKIRDQEQRRIVYKQKLLEILKSTPELHIPEKKFEFYANAVVTEMIGYGIIDPLVRDDKLEEIMVIGPKKPVFLFHREYEMMTSNIEFYSDDEIEDLVNRIAREVGRRVDISSPLLDARLPDGSRVNATIQPASVGGATLTIRKFREDPYTIIDLISKNTLTTELAAFLWICSEGMGTIPANLLISGGTGSGKTTLLNVLAAFVPPTERVITIEDTAELNLPLEHWIRMEARPPGLEGTGELTLDILTKNSLRMRPDRIIVGEVRHDEAFSLLTAMNTGHSGCFGTVHANSPQETIVRLTSPPMNVPEMMLSGLDMILVCHRLHDKKKGTIRRVTELAEVTGVLEGKAQTQTIFERDALEDTILRTSIPSNYIKKLMEFTGLTKKQIDQEISDREIFLKRLLKENLRSMAEISKATNQFLLERKESED